MIENCLTTFDTIANAIAPEKRYAKILLEECSPRMNRDRILSVLQKQDIRPVSYEILRSEYPGIILLRIQADNLREAVIKLTENGFNRLKAVHPAAGAGIR